VSLYLPYDFTAFEVSREISQLLRAFAQAFSRKKQALDPALVQRAGEVLTQTGLSVDDAEFIRILAGRLQTLPRDERTWEDVAYAMQILAGAEFRLRQLIAAEETPEPVGQARIRYNELSQLLSREEPESARRGRGRRQGLILETIRKRPGLYIAELYQLLSRLRAIHVTYATLWSDIRSLEKETKMITEGGPQGSPRYCFLHPKAIEDRRVYYNGYYCTEGVIEEQLTYKFEQTRRLVDLYLVNSGSKPVIMVLEFGIAREDLMGSRIKTFGKLHGFDFLQRNEGLTPKQPVESHDILRSLSLTRIFGQKEEHSIWFDKEAFTGYSLYSGSMAAARR